MDHRRLGDPARRRSPAWLGMSLGLSVACTAQEATFVSNSTVGAAGPGESGGAGSGGGGAAGQAGGAAGTGVSGAGGVAGAGVSGKGGAISTGGGGTQAASGGEAGAGGAKGGGAGSPGGQAGSGGAGSRGGIAGAAGGSGGGAGGIAGSGGVGGVAEADVCPGQATAAWDGSAPLVIKGNTSGLANDYQPWFCTSLPGRDGVWKVVPPKGGTLSVTVKPVGFTSVTTISQGVCDPSNPNTGCYSGTTPIPVGATANTPIFFFIDGIVAGSGGPFTLTVSY